MKIAVLMGGTSAERDVSMSTGRGIAQALQGNGHEVIAIDAAGGVLVSLGEPADGIGRAPPERDELIRLAEGSLAARLRDLPEMRDIDVVFVALHGGAGEDGRVQAMLDLVGTPYTGSGPLGSALAMDKLVSKDLFVSGGVPTPPWLVGRVGVEQIEAGLGGFPVVVKPSHEGSTVGVSVVKSARDLEDAFDRAEAFDGPALVERFIPGRELAVGVLGGEVLPIVEICPKHEIYDYECKYTKGMSEYLVPAPLSDELTAEVQDLALKAHGVLRLSVYSRVDFRLDENGQAWCLEANSLPGMTATSLLPKAAAARGIEFPALCDRIARLALREEHEGTDAAGMG